MDEMERAAIREKQRLEQYRNQFGLPYYLWQGFTFKSFEVLPGNDEAFSMALSYVYATPDLKTPREKFGDDEKAMGQWHDNHELMHHFLTLCGDCGRGKTHLALACGIWEVEKNGNSAAYFQVADLLSQMRHSFDDGGESYQSLLDRCKYVECLILDDLGAQKNTDWAVEQLDTIIDFRYISERKTIFTTNLKPAQLPKRIASRIKEGEVVILTCGDFRQLKAERRIEKRQVNAELKGIIGKGGRDG